MNKLITAKSDLNRIKKYNLFIQIFKPGSKSKILDVGASERELRETSNILEKRYPYPGNIVVLGVDNYNQFCIRYPHVKTVQYAGGTFPFKDNAFDFCWCNAVIEHVGVRQNQKRFLAEISRVSKRAFVTTPNRWFLYESHSKVILAHYFPREIFNQFLKITSNSYQGHLIHLLGLNDIKYLLKENNIRRYKIIKNRLFGFTIDFVIII